ncbi:MAG: nitroreductase/quinone reductase family protein [Pseudomonadales bacterium]
MKAVKIVAVLLLVYASVVVIFESLLGYYQPENQGTMVITTKDDEGNPHPRVVARLESDDTLYVAVNHWPRIWYYQALDNPNVTIEIDGETSDYQAIEIEGQEYDRVNSDHALGPVFRILTGFPPRRILRLDPQAGD